MRREFELIKIFCISVIQNRVLFYSYVFFFMLNIYFFFNPFVRNSGEFLITSNYLILIGLVFIFLWTVYAEKMVRSQINIELIQEQYLTEHKIYLLITFTLTFLFLLFHLLVLLLLNLYYTFLFGFSIDMYLNVINLYFNYLFLPLFISFLIGIYFAKTIKHLNPINTAISFLVLTTFIVLCVLNIERIINIGNILFVKNNGFYKSFTGIENFKYGLFIKISITILLISLLITLLKISRKRIRVFTNVFLLLIFAISSIYFFNKEYEKNLDDFYVKSYITEYQENRIFNTSSSNKDYSITSYDITLNGDNTPIFKIDVNLKNIKKKDVVLYLNKCFTVTNISADKLPIPFKQQGNSIYLSLPSVEDQLVTFTYSSNNGTSLNPIQKDYLFLPYFFNWLPSGSKRNDYFVRNDISVEYNPQKINSAGTKNIHSNIDDLFIQLSSNKDSLTLIKGDFITKWNNGKLLYYPKVWSGNIGSESDYSEVMKKETDLFNKVFHENKAINYDSIVIVPKYEIYSQQGFNDFWIQDNHQIILMDPFLDTNKESLFTHISKESTFNIAYSLLRDKIVPQNEKQVELLSLLFGIYYIHINKIPNGDTYLNYYLSLNKSKEVTDFCKLTLEEKEEKLGQIYMSLQGE